MRNALKSVAVFSVACALGVAALELGATLAYPSLRGRPLEIERIRARLTSDRVNQAPGGSAPDGAVLDAAVPDQPVILHPYFGFVINPEKRGVNDFGFFRADPMRIREDGKLVVAFFGGSVADQVFYLGQDAFRRALRGRPEFADIEIEIISLAVGGYKQPQQMLILSYLLALGAEFDVVVNIDGFNEIDSAHDNVMTGIFPYFPHTWKLHGRRGLDADSSAALGRVEILREERRWLRERFAVPWLSWSRFALVLWDLLDAAHEAEIRQHSARLERSLDEGEIPIHIRGPSFSYENDETMYRQMVRHWGRSSAAMDRLCRLYDIVYLHALQPNQYVPDSKPLTPEELEVAIDPNFPAIDRVPQAYPLLQAEGRRLREQLGIRFIDLSDLYAQEDRTIYNDFCCHVNQLGAQLMAEAIAGRVPGQVGGG